MFRNTESIPACGQKMSDNAIHTKEIRTNTYNTADNFQLGRFCSGRVSQVKQNSYKEGYTQMYSI